MVNGIIRKVLQFVTVSRFTFKGLLDRQCANLIIIKEILTFKNLDTEIKSTSKNIFVKKFGLK